jgi:hypothetical protein
MTVEVRGLEALIGDTAFAFFVVRMKQPVERGALMEMLRYVAPLIADSDSFIDDLPADLEQSLRILAMPWAPAEAGHAVDAQRRLIESAGTVGVEAAWFFQTGTSLPTEDSDDDDEDDEDDDDDLDEDDEDAAPGRARTKPERTSRAMTRDDRDEPGEPTWSNQLAWTTGEVTGVTKTTPIEIVDMTGEHGALDDDQKRDAVEVTGDDDTRWTYGPPPQLTTVRFPVDGYPAILDELDWEDVGVAVKLAGDIQPGEGTVLFAFHTLWLAPYAGRYRNASVTIDRKHHAAHLWVDRFAVPCSAREQVQHLLWVLSKLDEVTPIVHARFAGASIAQKYAGLTDDESEPFVLGGNPLLAVHAQGGEANVDAWIASQTAWSREEIAQMLRELAIEIVTAKTSDEDAAGEEVDALFDSDTPEEPQPAYEDDEDEDDDDDDEDDDDDGTYDDEDDEDDDDDDEAEGNEDDDRGRQITGYAGELLAMRARAGRLDARAADALLPALTASDRSEHRRRAVVQIIGALRHRPGVPDLIDILERTMGSSPDAVGKHDVATATAEALGAIADPAAIRALSRVVAARGTPDEWRSVAADALASCLAAAPEPRDVDDAVLAGLIATIRERNDAELNANSQLAYGRIVHALAPERRATARRQLADCESARDDSIAMLARHAALVLASPTSPSDPPPPDLAPLLHDSLTSLDYDHEYTVRNLRVALRVAEIVPELVNADDLVWLTRFAEPDIRSRAHALLAQLGKPIAPAKIYDRLSTTELDDDELVSAISDVHVIGRAALIAEAGRRDLERARRAIIDACHDVISRARAGGENLLDPDIRILEAAVPLLCDQPLDDDVVALFDRMLRHSNYHVKWELLQNPPHDERLIGGMFQVVSEKWGWQEKTAKSWLEAFAGTAAYEAERQRVPVREEVADDGAGVPDLDDEDMN